MIKEYNSMYIKYSVKKIALNAFDISKKILQEIGNKTSKFLIFLFFRPWIDSVVHIMYYWAVSVKPLNPLWYCNICKAYICKICGKTSLRFP